MFIQVSLVDTADIKKLLSEVKMITNENRQATF